jgi:hypothetical protein
MPWSILRVVTASVLVAACQRVPLDDEPPPEDTDTDTGTGGEPTTSGGNDDDDDGGPLFGCEPGDDTACPMGQKCTALSEGGPQNHFQCVNDDGMLLAGEDCSPAPGTGQDACTSGTTCLGTFLDADVGTCIEVCNNDADCEPGKCTESPYTLTPFCADACDPLVPDCPPGRGCLQADDRFICGMILEETDIGVNAEPCDSINLRGCAEGYACMTGALVPNCNSGACCTNVCDQSLGDGQCISPALCKPLFPEPAPGFDLLGACYVPT